MTTEDKQEERTRPGFSSEGIQDFLDNFQERIQERRAEARENFRSSKLFKDFDKRRLEFEEQLDGQITKLLGRVGVPSREELRNLERKVSRLDRDYQKWHKSQLSKAHAAKTKAAAKAETQPTAEAASA